MAATYPASYAFNSRDRFPSGAPQALAGRAHANGPVRTSTQRIVEGLP